jgi:hypothetical protein
VLSAYAATILAPFQNFCLAAIFALPKRVMEKSALINCRAAPIDFTRRSPRAVTVPDLPSQVIVHNRGL